MVVVYNCGVESIFSPQHFWRRQISLSLNLFLSSPSFIVGLSCYCGREYSTWRPERTDPQVCPHLQQSCQPTGCHLVPLLLLSDSQCGAKCGMHARESANSSKRTKGRHVGTCTHRRSPAISNGVCPCAQKANNCTNLQLANRHCKTCSQPKAL